MLGSTYLKCINLMLYTDLLFYTVNTILAHYIDPPPHEQLMT